MKVRIYITLKKNVLDIQGKAIENTLVKDLGFKQVSSVNQGKIIELKISESSPDKITKIIEEICDKLLVNKIMEDYTFEIIKS